jgi:hypothetical protein
MIKKVDEKFEQQSLQIQELSSAIQDQKAVSDNNKKLFYDLASVFYLHRLELTFLKETEC